MSQFKLATNKVAAEGMCLHFAVFAAFSVCDYRQAENGEITQAMDGNGYHKILFFFICNCKYKSTYDLSKRQINADGVGENKNQGT